MNDHTCRFEDWSGRRVVALTICAKSPKTRAALIDVLKKHKLDGGPVRIDAAGNQTHVLRWDNGYGSVFHRESAPAHGETDPAVSVDGAGHCQPDGRFPPPRAVRLDGEWTKGASPLTVPRSSLPAYQDEESFWTEVQNVLRAHEPKVEWVNPPCKLTAEQKAAIAEDERLEAELAKRDDDQILAEVERRLMHLSTGGFGATPYDRAQRINRAKSTEGRIAIYDTIVAERAAEEQRRRRAG
jgi:hypothetical protein